MVEEEIGGSGRRKLGFDEIEEEVVAEFKKCKLVKLQLKHQEKLTFIITTGTAHSLSI